MRPVFLHGRGLVSSLGADLSHAVAALAGGGVAPKRVALPGGTEWPYFSINNAEPDWFLRAQRIIDAAIQEAGVTTGRDAPLFVASSSLEIGAMEIGVARPESCLSFAEQIAGWLGWTGPVYLVSTACISSLQAMLAATKLIASGVVNDAVVLGIELHNRFSISGFAALQLLTPTAPKPLGSGRDGIALGEAAAVLHLSSRPARWQMRGGNSIVDGRDPTGTIPLTVAELSRQALAAAGLEPAASPVTSFTSFIGLPAACNLIRSMSAGSIHYPHW
jgi:3-oxoacyl-[acyl-carrier-protein] synthase I